MLLVQQYLERNSFGALITDHGVYASLSKNNRKISLNYSQIESSNSDKLAQECRGLILSKVDDSEFEALNGRIGLEQIVGKTKVVAAPFFRFFNYGMEQAIFDDKKFNVFEKMDGTLNIVYFDDFQNQWHVATRSVPEADVSLNDFTFRDLFNQALDNLNVSFDVFTQRLSKNNTYIFELTSFYNRVVVKYDNTNITLLGVRDRTTLQEFDIYKIDIGVPSVDSYGLSDITQIIKYVNSKSPLVSEGVVICDSNFNRVKVKSSAYVALHHTISHVGSSDRNLLSLILSGNDDDVVNDLPKPLADKIVETKSKLIKLIHNFNENYNRVISNLPLNSNNIRKDFALSLGDVSWKAPYFQLFSEKCQNFNDFIEKSSVNGKWSDTFLDVLFSELNKL